MASGAIPMSPCAMVCWLLNLAQELEVPEELEAGIIGSLRIQCS